MKRPFLYNLLDPEFYDEHDDEQERPRRRHLGVIIDKSYFDTYHIIKGNNAYSMRICPYCMEEVELGFSKVGKNGGFAGTLPHECKSWVDEMRHRLGVIEKCILPDNGFIFEEK